MNDRYLDALTKLKKEVDDVKVQVNTQKELLNDYKSKKTFEKYDIKDGKWYYDGIDTGQMATGPQGEKGDKGEKGDNFTFDDLTPEQIILLTGPDGLDGVDGKDGKPGKDGKDGRDGRDGIDGRDGKDGKDGETPELEIGEIKSVSTYDPAKVTLKKNKNKYVIDMDIPRGRPGVNGSDGSNGSPAKINGEETLNIVAGTNIILNQSGDTLTISARGGGSGGSATDVRINGTSITDENDIANIVTEGTYNADTNPIATMDDLPTVPTNVSSFTNDAGYLTSYTETDPVFSASAAAGITSSDISNWNGKGTYSKPSGGIPSTDLSSSVQTSLGKADTALQSEQYTGTITGITMNGVSKGTSGVVDLGTVVTDKSDKQDTLVSGTNIKTINNQSLLGSGNINISGGGGTATDVQVNGTSIVQNDVANLLTKTAYDAETNKLATESDLFSGDYDDLTDKPKINNIPISGNKTPQMYGIQPAGSYAVDPSITTNQINVTQTFTLNNNTEYRNTLDMTSITLNLPSTIDNNYCSWLVFPSGSTATSLSYPNTIIWSGDDVSNNAFVPVSDKTYNVCFWYDSINVNAVVRGA